MDLARFVQIYILQLGVGGIYFLFIAALILRRSRKNLNKIFSLFFISVALGTIVNVFYAPIESESLIKLVEFLHILTFYLFTLAQVFLLIFNLMILKSEAIINAKKQKIIIIIYTALLSILFIVGLLGGVRLDPSTKWKPVWELPFFLTAFIVCIPTLVLPILYFSVKIFQEFRDEQLRKKWRYFMAGVLLYFLMWFGTSISNFLAEDIFRNIWAFFALVSLLATYTMYYGVGKQIE
jgi:hypothetical protein